MIKRILRRPDPLTVLRQTITGWRWYALLAVVFVVSFIAALNFVKVTNTFDWDMFSQGMRYMLRGQNPYPTDWVLTEHYEFYYPPWSVIFFGALAYFPPKVILALDVAIWIVYVLDRGRSASFILLIHPLFIMLMAAANVELISGLVGYWLIISGATGWKRGIALLLIAVKPQTMIVFIALEGLRTLLARDWQALIVAGGIGGVFMALFPLWIPNLFANPHDAWTFSASAIGVGGVPLALLISAVVAAIFAVQKRLDEWRTLALMASLIWTPYVMLFSYITMVYVMARSSWWRVVLYTAFGLGLLPFFFQEYHGPERTGLILMMLAAALLSVREPDQGEGAIAARGEGSIVGIARRAIELPGYKQSSDESDGAVT